MDERELTEFVARLGEFRATLTVAEQRLLDALLVAAAEDDTGDVQGYGLSARAAKQAALAAIVALGIVGGTLAMPQGTALAAPQEQPTLNGNRGGSTQTSSTSTQTSRPATNAATTTNHTQTRSGGSSMQPHVTTSGGTGRHGGGLSSWQQDEILRQQELGRLQQQLQAQLRNPQGIASTVHDMQDVLNAARARRGDQWGQAGPSVSGDAARLQARLAELERQLQADLAALDRLTQSAQAGNYVPPPSSSSSASAPISVGHSPAGDLAPSPSPSAPPDSTAGAVAAIQQHIQQIQDLSTGLSTGYDLPDPSTDWTR
jgi:hypothetical protein